MALQWPLIIFTTLLAWAAGLFASQCFLALKGGAKKTQMISWIVAAVLLATGGIAAFFHLGHAERIFNGFGEPTSGVTQELIALVVLAIVAVIFLILMKRSDDGETVPAWACILGIVASAALLVVMAHSYMMPARPTWNSLFWVVYILGNACAFGPASLAALMATRDDEMDGMGTIVLIGTAVGCVCAIVYALTMQFSAGSFETIGMYFDPCFPNKPMMDATATVSSAALVLWGGAVVVGGVMPVVLAFFYKGKTGKTWLTAGAIIVALVLVGAVCMRAAFYITGLNAFMFY